MLSIGLPNALPDIVSGMRISLSNALSLAIVCEMIASHSGLGTISLQAARSFRSTWKTILAANLVSFIAAAVLFVLSVGSVRGFALYLGVTTICDVIVLWFFTRPAVILMAETGRLDGHDPFGIGPMPEAAPQQPPPAPAPGGGGS